MYKLKDIITSGGSNAKINKSIDRYILSKKEKKDIIKNIKHIKDNSQNNDSSTLTKGKKILSEYYYFSLGFMENNNNNMYYFNILNGVMRTFGFRLEDFEEFFEKISIIENVIGEDYVLKGETETNNIIVKYKFDNTYRYIYDSLPPNSDKDITNTYIAIRKYCPLYYAAGSGLWMHKYNLTNFIDCFDLYIYNAINSIEPGTLTEEELNQMINQYKQLLNDMIKDISITEEEFWAEAKIINDINEIS